MTTYRFEDYYEPCVTCGLPIGRGAMKARGWVRHICVDGIQPPEPEAVKHTTIALEPASAARTLRGRLTKEQLEELVKLLTSTPEPGGGDA